MARVLALLLPPGGEPARPPQHEEQAQRKRDVDHRADNRVRLVGLVARPGAPDAVVADQEFAVEGFVLHGAVEYLEDGAADGAVEQADQQHPLGEHAAQVLAHGRRDPPMERDGLRRRAFFREGVLRCRGSAARHDARDRADDGTNDEDEQ